MIVDPEILPLQVDPTEGGHMTATPCPIAQAQKIRLQRLLMASGLYLCSMLIVLGSYFAGLLAGDRALHYVVAVVLLNAFYVGMIRSDLNLRLRDPSMSMMQFVNSLWPAIYIMYFVTNSQVRGAFLLVAVLGMTFGMFRLDLRRLVILASVAFSAYLLLLAAIQIRAPERLNLSAEVIVAFAYAAVLALTAYTSSYVGSLRRSLQERNKALSAAMADLRILATHDALTGLPNRGALVERLDVEVARSNRRHAGERPLAVCLLDVDHFKHINDIYGHDTGDATLQQLAGILQASLRRGDFVGRFGGEEFLLILPATTRAGAMLMADRVRARIASHIISELPLGERISASLGVAVHAPGETATQMLRRADAALYRAKGAGRNRVIWAEESPGDPNDPQGATGGAVRAGARRQTVVPMLRAANE